MASISLDLVRAIVEVCGFRPTKAGLARLYTRVMASALIAGGVEDMDLEQVFSEALGSGAGAKASGLLLGGATDGLVGAYITGAAQAAATGLAGGVRRIASGPKSR